MGVERRRTRDPLLWLALASVAGFVTLAALVAGRGTVAFDDPVIRVVTGLPVPTGAWEALTFLGGNLLIVLGVLLVVALLGMRRVGLAVAVGIALLLATFATDAMKDFVARPRPSGDPLVPAGGYSFPSGHTLESTVTYGLIGLVAWRSRLPPALRGAVVVAAVALPLLVGLSRIALGVHYPSDVLAGWLAGIAVVACVAAVARTPGFDPVDRPAPE